jgi:hypothetical protein
MKRTLLFALLSMAAVAIADVVPTVQWDVETGRLIPAPYALSIRRGESANLEPRFLSYNTAMNLTGSVVQLRYWYTGQTGYYAATGSLMTATGRVHIAWYDALCPASNALNYEVRATLGTSVLARAYGPLNLLAGSGGTQTNGTVWDEINWATTDQLGGTAVLSNQLGLGATWTGSNWTFAASSTSENFATNAAFLSVSNAAINAYPSSNPFNYVTATITNGLASTGYVAGVVSGYLPTSTVYVAAEADTNALTQLHSITGRVAMALTNESDTFPSILDRSLFASNSVGRTVNILGSPSPVSFVVPQSWFLEFGNLGGRTNFLGVDAADYFIRVNADGTAYRMHDDDSFVAGVDFATAAQGARADLALTNLTAAGIAAAGGVTNGGATINGSPITNGATITVTAGGGVSAPSTWDMDLTWGDVAQATTNDSVGLVAGQLSGQSIYNVSNTVRYASFCTALTNVTTATGSTAFTVPLGYGGTGGVFYVKQSQATNYPVVFALNDGANTLAITAQVTAVDTETSIPFAWPVWATNAGTVVGVQATISGASTNLSNVRYWGVNRKMRLLK